MSVAAPARQPLWTSQEATIATGGRLHSPPFAAYGVAIDSRQVEPGDLFVALKDARDGHDFVHAALERGAAAALVSRPVDQPSIEVDDTLRALERLASVARERTPALRCAVTGSVGKTSVTQAIAAGLRAAGPAHAAVQSFNNHIGVPLTLARMPRGTARAVFELGMNHAREIGPLSRLVQPHVAVVTNVGPVHTEAFPDGEAGVARAKAEVFEGLQAGGAAVLDAEGPWFGVLADAAARAGARLLTCGTGAGADARLLKVEEGPDGAVVRATLHGAPVTLRLRVAGAHWGANALLAWLALDAMGVQGDAAVAALQGVQPLAGRGAERTVRVRGGEIRLIDESYNANPLSMAAALRTLGARSPEGRRVAVLTDMLELGPQAAAHHAALADAAASARIDRVHCAGPLMRSLHDALPAAIRGAWAEDAATLAPAVVADARPGDVVVVKGSKGSKASLIAEALGAISPDAVSLGATAGGGG